MAEFDPRAVQVRPAATVMIIDDLPDLQLLMLRRDARTVFAGGMWVFPGGSLDDRDDHRDYETISEHRSDANASALLELSSGGLAYYIAAIRECFEEAGVLLARRRGETTPISLADSDVARRFEDYRDQVNDGSLDFLDMVRQEDLILDAGFMHYVARWITPLGPPRRFDARVFITRMPAGQKSLHDNRETVHSGWWSPQEVLKRVSNDDMVMMPVTERMVESLSLFPSADSAMEAAAANRSDQRARVPSGTTHIVLPGEAGYKNAVEDIETGWVRLRPEKEIE